MRIIALDHGAARVGVAICDPTETLTRPLTVVGPDAAEIDPIVAEHEPELIVVGLPITLSGEAGEQAEAAEAYATQIRNRLQTPVITYDERLTTRMAESSARAGASAASDALAAAHLLESYLQMRSAEAGTEAGES